MRIAVLYSYAPQAGIIEGLKELGHEVKSFYYGINNVTFIQRIQWKLFKTQDKLLTKQFNKAIAHLFTEHKKSKFDFLIMIKGKKINQSSKIFLNRMNSVYKVLWTTDSVSRFPYQLSVKDIVDKVYMQDGDDVDLVEGSEWLPLGYDANLYKPGLKKDLDILLFGNCNKNYYSKRSEYFVEASKLGEKYKIKFVGSNLDKRAKIILSRNNVEIVETLDFKDFAQLVSRSKIAINIHQDDGGKAINPLFFAIPGSGTVQITDNKDYYRQWLVSDKEYFPVEINSLNKKLERILNSYELKNTLSIVKNIEDKHSYKALAKKMITQSNISVKDIIRYD